MDIQVQELIDKIKKEGIDTAAHEADHVKFQAEMEAKQVIEAAKKEAAEIVEKGKRDAERAEKAGIAALQQASRNLVLAFKDEIQALLDKIVEEQLDASYDIEVLKAALPEVIKAWTIKGSVETADSLAVLLPEASLTKLKDYFSEKLASELKKGLELKSSRNLTTGFRISKKNGSAYYDFSAESVAELLSAYLNPNLAEILKTSAKEQ